MHTHRLATVLFAVLAQAASASEPPPPPAPPAPPRDDKTAAYWVYDGEKELRLARAWFPGMPEKARNVILFVGDGMGVSTVTAARIFEGQKNGGPGEENLLAFEKLPHVALSRTYSVNQQVSDSAPTMSAMVTGVKTNDGVLSVDASVAQDEKDAARVAAASRETLLELAEKAGLATGVVTTARLTHATPAATYAHTAARDWEADSDRPSGATVPDIASQLIDRFGKGGIGDGLEVAMGGGRSKFLPRGAEDPEDKGERGARADGRDLTKEWASKFGGTYVWDRKGFEAIDEDKPQRVLGLFERSHMEYETDRAADTAGEPSLAEMTVKAIRLLSHNPKGFFLVVEAGRIDHGHHAGNAARALADTVALSDAVRAAMQEVEYHQTLVVVTADHSHTLTMSGYPKRGNPILGTVVEPGATAPVEAEDGRPYTTLGYANGRGFQTGVPGDAVYTKPIRAGRVKDIAKADTTHPDYHQEALVPLDSETHGGEDVPIYAGGPASHLIHGVQQQSYLFYVMRAALGL